MVDQNFFLRECSKAASPKSYVNSSPRTYAHKEKNLLSILSIVVYFTLCVYTVHGTLYYCTLFCVEAILFN